MKDIIANTSPVLGAVAVFKYPKSYHFAVVESVGVGIFTITETNFNDGCETQTINTREVSFADPRFLGFFIPD